MADDDFSDVHDALGLAPTDSDHPSFWQKVGQTWPARLVQSALRAAQLPGDVAAGRVNPLSGEGIERAADLAGFVTGMPGGVGGLGSGARLAVREALKGDVPEVLNSLYYKGYRSPYSPQTVYEKSPLGMVTEKPLTDEAIDAALTKNPGASIMDIAGVHVSGPSEKIANSLATPRIDDLATYPREAPPALTVPERARELGFTVPALHGTRGASWIGPEDQLKLPETQLGVHFGNPKQAAHFATRGPQEPFSWEAPRTYPVVLQMQNPLEMKDMGSWDKEDILNALHQINEGTHTDWAGSSGIEKRVISPEAKGQFPLKELDKLNSIEDVRDYLSSKGYDSVKYINTVEDQGHPSYILFNDSPVARGSVIGARSPFAAFDPSKLHLPSLAAGIGALSLYPFRGDEERQQ